MLQITILWTVYWLLVQLFIIIFFVWQSTNCRFSSIHCSLIISTYHRACSKSTTHISSGFQYLLLTDSTIKAYQLLTNLPGRVKARTSKCYHTSLLSYIGFGWTFLILIIFILLSLILFEDEYYFVIECSIFTDLRKRYISKYYWTNPSMYKLKQLFDCTNVSKLIKYIYVLKAFELKSYIYKDNILVVEKDKIYMYILWVLILYHYVDKYL